MPQSWLIDWVFGPLGLMCLMVLVTAIAWPWLRRTLQLRRRRVVRVAVGVTLLVAIGAIWGIPDQSTPGRLLLGRHGWLERTGSPAPSAAVQIRVLGPNVLPSLVETGMVLLVAVAIEQGIHRRLAARDKERCGRCGYELRQIASAQCPECGRERPASHGELPPASSA